MNLIAVDPGKSGGIAHLKDGVVTCYAMPETEKDLVDLLARLCVGNGMDFERAEKIYLEKVGGFIKGNRAPGSHMFEFGKWASAPMWIALCYQIPLIHITPQNWQKTLSLGTGGKSKPERAEWKRKLKAEAQRRNPGMEVTLKTADALLILEAARILEK